MTALSPSIVDRDSVVDFVREALERPSVPHAFDFEAAGIAVRLCSGDRSLSETYAPRLKRIDAVVPHYTVEIHITDELPRWSDERLHPRDLHARLAERGLCAAYPYREGMWHLLDLRSRRGLLLLSDSGLLPPWDSGAPLRQHLHWVLKSEGMRLVHAATLGHDGVGVLFLGNSGAGKSATTLAGLSVGLQTVGDDYLALAAGGEVVARSLYRIVKQDRLGLGRVPQLAAASASMPVNWKGKVELDPDQHFPEAFASELRIRAVVLPRIARVAEPRLSPGSRGDAMLALMRSNLYQFPGEPEDGMQFFGSMLRRVPVFTADLGESFPQNGAAIRALIEQLKDGPHD